MGVPAVLAGPASQPAGEATMAQQVNVRVKQISGSASEGVAREHRAVFDRPEAKGGGNRGPMGGEAFLMGLGGCFMSNLLAAVQARDADVSDLALDITAVLEATPPRFSAVTLAISGNYPDRELMEKLVTIAERGCIVANTIKGSVDLSFSIA
jgi:putative redox protein